MTPHFCTLSIKDLLDANRADKSYLQRLLAALRKSGDIIDAKVQRGVEIQMLKDAIYAFCDSMHPVGVRQICYQMSAAGLIEKTEKAFDRCGGIIGTMRENGDLPWEFIRDNSRSYEPTHLIEPTHTPAEIIEEGHQRIMDIPYLVRGWVSAAFPHQFEIPDGALDREKWYGQPYHCEVWIEKKGLLGVIEPITAAWEVSLVAAAGQCSKTILYEAAQHHDEIARTKKKVVVLYFGDYDPAGKAIWHSLQARVRRYSETSLPEFRYMAVTEAQIAAYNLPTRPLKSKGTAGTRTFDDDKAVDLDAIPADILRHLVDESIKAVYDTDIADNNRSEVAAQIKTIDAAYQHCREQNSDLIAELNRLADTLYHTLQNDTE